MKSSIFTALSLAFLLTACTPQAAKITDQDKQSLKKAEQLRKSGKTVEAVNILREMQARHPANPAVLSPLGYALIDAGQPESAVEIFDRLIVLAPDNAMSYNGKAVAFDHTGNHLAAQELYQQALKRSPKAPTIENNLAMSLILNGQYDQAIALLEPLGHQPTVVQNLALAYALKGNRKKALELNLKNLSPEEAQENMRFYEQYARQLKKPKSPEKNIAFTETPAAEKK